MKDYSETERKNKIKEWADYADSFEERLEKAKEKLGEKYLLHPANRVKKLDKPYGWKND